MSSNGAARSLQPPADLPPVTEAHRRAAFGAMAWRHRTFADVQADPVLQRVVEIRATLIRNREYWAAKQAHTEPAPTVRTQHNFAMPPGVPRIF